MALADLAANLPAQAVSWRRIDPRAGWDDLTYLVARAADCLDFIAWTNTRAAQRRGAKWKSTIPYPGRKRHATPQKPHAAAAGYDAAALDRILSQPRKPLT